MVPRGVLMVGPPGTGKTLLARAVAGEANVPFFSVSGSGFVELFVGVGAARVRDLFAEARKRAPSIIFIDEIDAIGQRRAGSGAVVSNDEREQTLNQLLAEMDGFDPAAGVVVLGATNRPEVLDPALLRPGRFDRQVTIPLPNVTERAAILKVHVRDKKLAPDVDLTVVARGTPGFSGADLANLANEAAIFAVRDNRHVITADDFFAARDRVILGRREGSNVLLPEEKHAVAVHESGHALVAALAEHADPVAKVTILPAGQALGVTEQLPLVERHMYGEDYLYDSLAVRLGGRAAELVVLGQGSTGAGNDLAGRDRPGHQDGPRVRDVRRPRPGRLPRGRLGVPRRRRSRHVQPPLRRGDPGRDRRRGLQAAPPGRGPRGGGAHQPPGRTRRPRQPPPGEGDGRRQGRLPAGGPPRQVGRAGGPADGGRPPPGRARRRPEPGLPAPTARRRSRSRPGGSRRPSPFRRPASQPTPVPDSLGGMAQGISALPEFIPSPPINAFHIGPLEIHFYALGYIIGITLAILITRRRWRALGGDPDLVNDIALWVVPAGIIGGRIYFDITTPNDIPHVWYGAFAVWTGGLGIWGGVAARGRGRRLAAAPARHHRGPVRERHRPGAARRPGDRPDRQLFQQGAVRQADNAAMGPGDPVLRTGWRAVFRRRTCTSRPSSRHSCTS